MDEIFAFSAGRALTAIALSKRGYSTNSWIKRLALVVGRILGFIRIKRLLLKFIRLLDDRDTKFVGHFFGRAPSEIVLFHGTILVLHGGCLLRRNAACTK